MEFVDYFFLTSMILLLIALGVLFGVILFGGSDSEEITQVLDKLDEAGSIAIISDDLVRKQLVEMGYRPTKGDSI